MSSVNLEKIKVDHKVLKIPDSEGPTLFEWTIKTYPGPTWPMDLAFAVMALVPLCSLMDGLLYPEDSNADALRVLGVSGILMIMYLWWTSARQKTLYVYRITKRGGEVIYQVYFPKWAGCFFKCLAVFAFVVIITMIAIMPGAIVLIAGVGGMTIAAAITLMNWEPPPSDVHKTNWSRYDLVFIDRKRKMVVASYHHNPMVGFEARMKKEQVDEFVSFLRTVIPNAEFREARWEW